VPRLALQAGPHTSAEVLTKAPKAPLASCTRLLAA
jgi:hypothetical protein